MLAALRQTTNTCIIAPTKKEEYLFLIEKKIKVASNDDVRTN